MSAVTNAVNTVNNAANAASNATNAAASSSSSTASGATSAAQNGLNTNYTDFLKLLTTELQNQDPTTPMDPTAMIGQLASLSQVEQQITTNQSLTQLLTAFNQSQTNTAVSYIGAQVDTTGNQTQLTKSSSQLVYNLPAGASSATINITNSAGATVYSGSGTTIAGRNSYTWNGANSTTGATMPDGTYTFAVTAKDASGKALTATTYTTGIVTSVDSQNGVTSLVLGGNISVPLNSLSAVYTPGSNPGALTL